MYALHLTYNKPFDKHFFGVYKDLKGVATAVSSYATISESDVKAHLVASDVYIIEENSYRIEVGEINAQMVEYACGKLLRIQEQALLPH